MARKLHADDIRRLGFEWPKYPLIQSYAAVEDGKADLAKTIEDLRSSRAFYEKQIADAYAFKTQTGADYADFTDRFDDYVRMARELGEAVSYLESIIEAAEHKD